MVKSILELLIILFGFSKESNFYGCTAANWDPVLKVWIKNFFSRDCQEGIDKNYGCYLACGKNSILCLQDKFNQIPGHARAGTNDLWYPLDKTSYKGPEGCGQWDDYICNQSCQIN